LAGVATIGPSRVVEFVVGQIWGLDTVELVMAVEEDFDITIPDSAATKMFTVGGIELIVSPSNSAA
jgi:acyl carrier protein